MICAVEMYWTHRSAQAFPSTRTFRYV
uniref:Uncharacterized protein n=1 Tax=Anguilla anguilla TaxID=7936 RepID=A0A0E9TVX3_ANGAN